jgi:formate hydrogenlyase transcriptional activator
VRYLSCKVPECPRPALSFMATFSPELALPATIVIVEDEFLIANDLRRILTKAGYQVLGLAKSVAEAQVLVEQQPPCIVLIDIFL